MGNAVDHEELALEEWLLVVARRWRIIALMIVVSICLVGIRMAMVPPTFEARARLLVLPPDQAVNDVETLELYRNLVPTYKELLASRRVMDAVLRDLGLSWSSDEYRRRVRIRAYEESQVLDVFVRDSSPSEAARIANRAAEIMTGIAAEVMRENRLVLLDSAVPPEEPVSPRPALELSLAVLLGLLVGTSIGLALEVLDRRICDEAAVERRLGLPVLGVIPHIDL
ncbi:hypothetical protein E1B22_07175 [Thermaerobacter sp. FW80]|uniref:YveK family protein n=1 Tax=Thermaerobacter sp. FW80 TaxID=2546351 RepID=UPI001074C147|nr:Wzz/FepE/Etk N-terminal domain-containing protein [Thermaerobacter sp. FW80]QBS37606.1 hypothetical protein E1B22_07175 [Thermaerobacter sp. FW80]